MNPIRNIKGRLKNLASAAAYSPLGKSVARQMMVAPVDSRARQFIEAKGLEGNVRRIASEGLPEGHYFAKLTIAKWERHRGKPFRLLQGSTIVYGNEIEPPARGFPLEYRNIIVTSTDKSKFHLDIDAPYTLAIGRGAFTTPQQVKYDEQYGVEQHGDVFYSLRGNVTNPKKIFITFPGFGPSTSRISYAVSYLKAITDTDLADTLMICFQDRYLAAGSYMMVDSAGRPLYERVRASIEALRVQFGIDESAMLFFGASKGGSIAIHYAQDYPKAQLLLGVPQMNLPYYFNKPFFRDNLYRNRALHDLEQPEDLLRRYFAEGRKIDYFYTNSDELSNHSLIELAKDIPNLSKYRIAGAHSAVARAALPAMLGIIRQFISGRVEETFSTHELRTFISNETLQVQVRIDESSSQIQGANWFLESSLGHTRFLQALTDHTYKFVKFTSDAQRLISAYDPLEEISKVVSIEASGKMWTSAVADKVVRGAEQGLKLEMTSDPLKLETDGTESYAVIDGDDYGRFQYRCSRVSATGDTMEVHIVSNVDEAASEISLASRVDGSSHVALVASLDSGVFYDLMVLRLVIAAGVKRVLVVVHDQEISIETVGALAEVDWEDARIVIPATKSIPGIEEKNLPYSDWILSGRIVIRSDEMMASAL